MPHYIISYDLNGPRPTHVEMDAFLQSMGQLTGRLLETVWYIQDRSSRQSIYEHLRSKIGREDRLLVVEVAGATWHNLLVSDQALKTAIESA